MSSASASQLAFAGEFASFLVALTGLAAAFRAGLLATRSFARSALASGFLAMATASFLRGAVVVTEPDRFLLQGLRVAAVVALAVGLARWNGRRSRIPFGAGLVASVVAIVGAAQGSIETSDSARLVSAGLFAVALVLVSRRAMAARIATNAALLVLGVVLAVALAVSVTVADNVEGEAFDRYTARAAGEADAATAEARDALGPARLVAGALEAGRPALLARLAAAGPADPADLADLDAALTRLVGPDLLAIEDPVVVVGPDGAPLGATPTELPGATRLALSGNPVVTDAIETGGERQGVSVVGGEAFAVAAAPVVIVADDEPERSVASVVIAFRLDETYLRVLGTGGEDLSFSLATPSRVVAASGQPGETDVVQAVAGEVVERGARPRAREDGRFVAAAPIAGADDRPVLAFVVSAPSETAEATQEALFRTLFFVALAAALVAVAIGVLVGERIGRSLGRLTGAARRLESGDLATEIEARSDDELGVLGSALSTMAGSIQEMTDDLKAAAAEEAALRAQLAAVVSAMSEALLAIDRVGVVIECNAAAAALLDVAPGDAVGGPAAEAVFWRLPDGTATAFDRGDLIDGEPMAGELAVGQDTVAVVVTSGTLRNDSGGDAGAVLVFRDVRREQEVEDLKSTILANLGHELRTPLTPIKGYASMLRDRTLDQSTTASFAGEIISGVDQLERVVGQLVTFATIAAGTLDIEPARVDTEAVAADLRTRWADRIGPEHDLDVTVADGADALVVDRDLFGQALDELVDNAVKYSPDGGAVRVAFSMPGTGGAEGEPEGATSITVSDEGIGMSSEQLVDLSGAFTQVDGSSTRRFGGLGLGLACAERIVAAHGGRLAFASAEHRGTTVSIVFPADTQEVAGT